MNTWKASSGHIFCVEYKWAFSLVRIPNWPRVVSMLCLYQVCLLCVFPCCVYTMLCLYPPQPHCVVTLLRVCVPSTVNPLNTVTPDPVFFLVNGVFQSNFHFYLQHILLSDTHTHTDSQRGHMGSLFFLSDILPEKDQSQMAVRHFQEKSKCY